MSRRYGRNQRRQHRHRIAELEAQVIMLQEAMKLDRGLLTYQSQQISGLKECLRLAEMVLGPHHPAFPPKTVATDMRFGDPINMRSDRMSLGPLAYDTMPIDAMVSRWNRIEALTVDSIREDMDATKHLRVQYGDGRWGYAISRSAWHQIPREELARRVSRELGELITRELAGAGKRRAA